MRYLSIILFLFTTSLYAQIGCTHPQVCNLLHMLFPKTEIVLLKKFHGDPHHSTLTSQEVKKMIKVPILVLAPLDLLPWQKEVIPLRKGKTTLVLPSASPNILHNYSTTNAHILAHFWLYPEMLQMSADYITKKLHNLNPQNNKIEQTMNAFKELNSMAKCYANKILIISHNALIPLLQSLKFNAIAIKSSTHGKNLTPQEVKKIYQAFQKNREHIWIFEHLISLPPSIQQLYKVTEPTIRIDTFGHFPDSLAAPLRQLINGLKEYKDRACQN